MSFIFLQGGLRLALKNIDVEKIKSVDELVTFDVSFQKFLVHGLPLLLCDMGRDSIYLVRKCRLWQ